MHNDQLSTINQIMIYHNYPLSNDRWGRIGGVHVMMFKKSHKKYRHLKIKD